MSNAQTPKTINSDDQSKLLMSLYNKAVVGKLYKKGLRNYLIGCLMLDAGLRVGEVVQLTVSHLLFSGLPVNTLILTSDITKNKRERSVPVNTRLTEAISNFFKAAFSPTILHSSSLVFAVPHTNRCITTRQIENIILAAAMRSLGRPVNPHMLRHTFASKLLRVTNMRTVQMLLGHSCITSTQIYTHPNEEDKKKAIDAMEGSDREGNTRADHIEC